MKNNKKIGLMFLLFVGVIIISGCSDNDKTNTKTKSLDQLVATKQTFVNIEDNPAFNGEVKEFNVEAFQFGFDPAVITVNYGDKVIINASTRDVPHGLAINAFDVSMSLYKNKPDRVEFIADKKGEFTFYCNIPCGRGHGSMKGKFIIK